MDGGIMIDENKKTLTFQSPEKFFNEWKKISTKEINDLGEYKIVSLKKIHSHFNEAAKVENIEINKEQGYMDGGYLKYHPTYDTWPIMVSAFEEFLFLNDKSETNFIDWDELDKETGVLEKDGSNTNSLANSENQTLINSRTKRHALELKKNIITDANHERGITKPHVMNKQSLLHNTRPVPIRPAVSSQSDKVYFPDSKKVKYF